MKKKVVKVTKTEFELERQHMLLLGVGWDLMKR